MSKYSEELKRISRRMMEEKEPYYKDSRKYLNSVMKGLKQEDLISAILELNIHELKQCLASGVPGDAMHVANQRLKALKADIKAYIDEKGTQANMSVNVEQNTEVDNNVDEGIRTSKSGREKDSRKMGKTSTDSRD